MDAQAAGGLSSAVALQKLRVVTTQGHHVGRVFDVRTRCTPGSSEPPVVEAVLVGRGGWMERVGLRPHGPYELPWSAVKSCADGVLVVEHEAVSFGP